MVHQIDNKISGRCYFHWAVLIDKKSLNREIIEDTLELYLDPEGRNKHNTIKVKVD